MKILLFLQLIPALLLSWGAPTQISSAGVHYSPSVAVNSGGDGFAVWTTEVFGGNQIEAADFTAGVWGAPTTISGLGNNEDAYVAINTAGDAIAIWEDTLLGVRAIMSANFPVGGPWSAPSVLSSSNDNEIADLAMNGAGDAIAVWVNHTSDQIEARTCTFGGAWSAINVISVAGGRKGIPTVGIDNAGNYFIAWEEYQTGFIMEVDGVGGAFNPPIIASASGNNERPFLGVSTGGDALLVFENMNLNEIRGLAYTGGSWSRLPFVLSPPFCSTPKAAFSPLGGFVLWNNLESLSIQAIRHAAGVWDYPPVTISASSSNGPADLSITAAGTGYFTWANNDLEEIELVEFPIVGPPVAPLAISTGINNTNPHIASGGNTIVVWEQRSVTDRLIMANTLLP